MNKVYRLVLMTLIATIHLNGCAHTTSSNESPTSVPSNCAYTLYASVQPSNLYSDGQIAMCKTDHTVEKITARSRITLAFSAGCPIEIGSIDLAFNEKPVRCAHFLKIHNSISDSWGRTRSNAGLEAALEDCASETPSDWSGFVQNLTVSAIVKDREEKILWTGKQKVTTNSQQPGGECQ